MHRPLILPTAVLFLTTLGCLGAREPGPLEAEWGRVLFWEVVDLTSTTTDCTDSPDLELALELPPLQPNTFFMLRVADDGQTATATDCTETRASSCTDLDDFEFTVTDHVFEHVQTPEVVDSAGGCETSVAPVWTMIDDGEAGALEVSLTFPFEGDEADCQSLDDAIAAAGTNGVGLRDCETLLIADLEFVTAD